MADNPPRLLQGYGAHPGNTMDCPEWRSGSFGCAICDQLRRGQGELPSERRQAIGMVALKSLERLPEGVRHMNMDPCMSMGLVLIWRLHRMFRASYALYGICGGTGFGTQSASGYSDGRSRLGNRESRIPLD